MENKIFTVENVPKELDKNQFYGYNKTNGQVLLGKILGKTLDEHDYFFEVENNIYKVRLGFITSKDSVDISSTYIGFNNYESLKSYDEYDKLTKPDKTDKRKNYKYCVDKYSYYCRFTDPDDLFDKSSYKIFDTKIESEKCKLRGLKRIKKYSLLFSDKLNTLLKEIEEKQRLIGTEFTLTDLVVKDPDELKVGDHLLKIEDYEFTKWAFPFFLKGIKSGFKLKVKEVISNRLIRLNDDIILEEYDFRHNYALFKIENIEKVKLAITYSNSETIKPIIKKKLMYLKDLVSYCNIYENKPIPKDDQKYFNKKSYEETINAVNDFFNR